MTEIAPATARRILAVVLPRLLCELALQRPLASPLEELSRKSSPSKSAPRKAELPRAIILTDAVLTNAVLTNAVLTDTVSSEQLKSVQMKPEVKSELELETEIDAVNSAAYQLGIRPRQTIGQAYASVESLVIHTLPRSRVYSALKHIAEVALRFGSPVSFQAPDTVWVDVSGSIHLYESERELALELAVQIKALGHSPRVALASGPWLAQSFARYAQLEEAGILLVDQLHTARAVSELPILALPIARDAASWFSRLGLLSIQDLKTLPTSALAARLEDLGLDVPLGHILDLIQGRDDGVLIPHHPEEMPREDQFWEDPLESVEPLLFVLKGLSGRLSARLEGRGQAAQELLLTLHYDRSMAALATPEGKTAPDTKTLVFKLASPLFHAEDLERVMRLRLQRQELIAPTRGLSLQATSLAEARYSQMGLSGKSGGWAASFSPDSISTDPRTLTVLVAELSADIGSDSIGVLTREDSHLLEKSSALLPLGSATQEDASADCALYLSAYPSALEGLLLPRVPTRLLDPPLEIHAPVRKSELWVIREQAFVVASIHFEQRLEGIEWWGRTRVFRDYFRVWLAHVRLDNDSSSRSKSKGGGLEALVYRDRERDKTYLHALYD
jgi:protein ImuB